MGSKNATNDPYNLGLSWFPRLILLDTNVVQNLLTFGEYIYDNDLSDEMESFALEHGSRFLEDIRALADIISLGRRNGLPLAVAQRTLREIQSTPMLDKREALTRWALELFEYFTRLGSDLWPQKEDGSAPPSWPLNSKRRYRLYKKLLALPDESDRELVLDAIDLGCDVLLTMYYKTILSHRDEINRLGLTAMAPTDLLKKLRPWVGLMR